MLHLANVPILLHVAVELCAAALFIRHPGRQLHDPSPSRDAVLILRSYAGTLLSLNAVCLSYFAFNGVSEFGERGTALSASLSIYHVSPIYRAWDQMQRQRLGGSHHKLEYGVGAGAKGNFGGHLIIFLGLVSAALYGWFGRPLIGVGVFDRFTS